MAAQSNSSQEQPNAKAKDEESGNFSLNKSMPNFSSDEEEEDILAPRYLINSHYVHVCASRYADH
jgi:hypothetical protein